MGCPVVEETMHLHPAQQADILRYWLLYTHGGMTVDHDTICLKPLVMPEMLGEVAVCRNRNQGRVAPGYIVCRKGSSLMKQAFDKCMANAAGNHRYIDFGTRVLAPIAKRNYKRWELWPTSYFHSAPWTRMLKPCAEHSMDVRCAKHWNPAAYGYHVGSNVASKVETWPKKRLLVGGTFMAFLFHRAMGRPLKPGRARTILNRLPPKKPLTIIEVGTHRARNMAVVLQQRPNAFAYFVDPWEDLPQYPNGEGRFQAAKRTMAFAAQRTAFIRERSDDAAPMFQDNSVDMVFIDGDHRYEQCRKDIANYIGKVRPGGWLSGHDYHLPGVRRAVDETLSNVELGRDNTWHKRIPIGPDQCRLRSSSVSSP
jgi:hypothetical protein